MTTYEFYRQSSYLGSADVEHNMVVASNLPVTGKDWETVLAFFNALGVEARPVVEEDTPPRPTELVFKGNVYRFKWSGEVLVRCSIEDAHGFVQDVRASDLPLAVRRSL